MTGISAPPRVSRSEYRAPGARRYPVLRVGGIGGVGCAAPPYPSMRIDHASASARSALRIACAASSRAPSARIFAAPSRELNIDSSDLVLMAHHLSGLCELAQSH